MNIRLIDLCVQVLKAYNFLCNTFSSYDRYITKSLRRGHTIHVWKELCNHFDMIYLYAGYIFKHTETYEKYIAYKEEMQEMCVRIQEETKEADEFVKHPYGYTVKTNREKMKRAQQECKQAQKGLENQLGFIRTKYDQIKDNTEDPRLERELYSDIGRYSLRNIAIMNLMYIIQLTLHHEQERNITP